MNEIKLKELLIKYIKRISELETNAYVYGPKNYERELQRLQNQVCLLLEQDIDKSADLIANLEIPVFLEIEIADLISPLIRKTKSLKLLQAFGKRSHKLEKGSLIQKEYAAKILKESIYLFDNKIQYDNEGFPDYD